MKRTLVAILLVLVLLASVACNKTEPKENIEDETTRTTEVQTTATPEQEVEKLYFNETGYPICDETITITASGIESTTPDWNATSLIQGVEERLGIKIECDPFPQDSWETQLTLMLASDSLPDILVNTWMSAEKVADYGAQGYLLAMNEYIDKYAPSINKYMNEYNMLKPYMTSPDGNIYRTVLVNDNPFGRVPRVFMNKHWLANLGLEQPKTLDELTAVLRAFKEQDANGNGDPNDEIPLSTLFYTGRSIYLEADLLTAFGIYAHARAYIPQVDENGTVFLADTTDVYKEYLKYLHMLYVEELLDNECFIQTDDELRAKGAADLIGYAPMYAPFVFRGVTTETDDDFIWCGAFTSEYNDTRTVTYTQAVQATTVNLASSKTEYPEAIVRLFDYFFENEMVAAVGFEGIDYDMEKVELAGVEYDNIVMHQPDGYDSGEEYRYEKAVINNAFNVVSLAGTSYQPLLDMDYDSLMSEDVLNVKGWAAITAYGAIRNPEITFKEVFPGLSYTEQETEDRSLIASDLISYLYSAKTDFVTGAVDIDTGWEEYLKTLQEMGLDELLAIEQAAYDRTFAD